MTNQEMTTLLNNFKSFVKTNKHLADPQNGSAHYCRSCHEKQNGATIQEKRMQRDILASIINNLAGSHEDECETFIASYCKHNELNAGNPDHYRRAATAFANAEISTLMASRLLNLKPILPIQNMTSDFSWWDKIIRKVEKNVKGIEKIGEKLLEGHIRVPHDIKNILKTAGATIFESKMQYINNQYNICMHHNRDNEKAEEKCSAIFRPQMMMLIDDVVGKMDNASLEITLNKTIYAGEKTFDNLRRRIEKYFPPFFNGHDFTFPKTYE